MTRASLILSAPPRRVARCECCDAVYVYRPTGDECEYCGEMCLPYVPCAECDREIYPKDAANAWQLDLLIDPAYGGEDMGLRGKIWCRDCAFLCPGCEELTMASAGGLDADGVRYCYECLREEDS